MYIFQHQEFFHIMPQIAWRHSCEQISLFFLGTGDLLLLGVVRSVWIEC